MDLPNSTGHGLANKLSLLSDNNYEIKNMNKMKKIL